MLAIEEHRRILRGGRVRTGSLKGLFRGFQTQLLAQIQGAHDRAFCCAEILSFLAAADDSEELFFSDNKRRVKKETFEQLDAKQLTSWVAHHAQRNAVRDVLVAVAADLGKPFATVDVENLDKKFILKPKAADALRSLADNLAHNLSTPPFDVWRSQTKRGGVDVISGASLAITVGQDITRTHPNREQRFLLGRKLMALTSGHHLLKGLDGQGLATLITAIGRSIDKAYVGIPGVDPGEVDAVVRRIGGAISRKAKAQLTEPLAQIAASPKIDFEAYIAAIPLTENRAGLVVAAAFDAAARLVARDTGATLAGDTAAMTAALESNPQLADLVAYALSDEHFQARQGLRMAIDS